MTLIRTTIAVARKDLRLEMRRRETVSFALPFSATLLLTFGLALGPGQDSMKESAPAILWLVLLFAGILLLRRAFDTENEDDAYEGLVLAPADRGGIFLGKLLAVVMELVVLQVLSLLGTIFFFDVALNVGLVMLAGSFVLGAVALCALGTIFATLSARARAREALLPLLVLPLVTPVLLAGIRVTQSATTAGGGDTAQWLTLLAAAAVIGTASGMLLFEHALDDS